MKFTDLYQMNVNLFTSHIVVDLIIVIIITAISILLLFRLAEYKSMKELKSEKNLNHLINYEIIIFIMLVIVHLMFSFLPMISFGLNRTVSTIELIVLPFSYGIYLTFFMKKVDILVEKKFPIFETLYFNRAFRLFLHFSIVPLLITTVLVIIN
jgi:uncharacterized membrane protein YbjE (DUF340 family)